MVESNGNFTTSYQRLDKAGSAETGWVTIDTSKNPAVAMGVALSRHALVIESLGTPYWQARWLTRDGTPLTSWFGFIADYIPLAEFRFLMDGSLVLRFGRDQYQNPGPWKYRFEDAKAAVSSVPNWLATRANNSFYVVRNGRGYVSWGGGGQCGSRLEVLAVSESPAGVSTFPT